MITVVPSHAMTSTALRTLRVSLALACTLLDCNGGTGDSTDSAAASDGGTTGATGSASTTDAGSTGAAATEAVTTGGTTGGTTGAPVDCFDYGAFDGSSPVVSFKTDVLPIFQGSCGISPGCHGAGSPDRPYLGPPLSDTATAQNIADIFANTVDFAAFKEPGMSRVAPGDPEHSFLMHKLDGLLKCETLACSADKSCGGPMPEGPKLPDDKLDTIRRWIAQGAKND